MCSPKQKEGFLFMMNSYPEFTFNINSSQLSNEVTEYVHFLEVISNAIWSIRTTLGVHISLFKGVHKLEVN